MIDRRVGRREHDVRRLTAGRVGGSRVDRDDDVAAGAGDDDATAGAGAAARAAAADGVAAAAAPGAAHPDTGAAAERAEQQRPRRRGDQKWRASAPAISKVNHWEPPRKSLTLS